MKVKKTICLEQEVIDGIQTYADKNGISFSAGISILTSQAIQADETLKAIKKMTKIQNFLGLNIAGDLENSEKE